MDAPCYVDAWDMERLFKKAEQPDISTHDKIELYEKAVALYQGDYLTESYFEEWMLPYTNYYKRIYIQAVLSLSELYSATNQFEKTIELMEQAVIYDPYEESMHEKLMEAYIETQHISQALAHYNNVSNMLYRELSIRPSEKLQNMYHDIFHEGQEFQTDLTVIEKMLQQGDDRGGAFYCEFDMFRLVYQLEVRALSRSGLSVYMALISITLPDHSQPDPSVGRDAFSLLKQVSISSLRKGDVLSQFSDTQMIYLLPTVTFEDGEMVISRIKKQFEKEYQGEDVVLKSSLLVVNPDLLS